MGWNSYMLCLHWYLSYMKWSHRTLGEKSWPTGFGSSSRCAFLQKMGCIFASLQQWGCVFVPLYNSYGGVYLLFMERMAVGNSLRFSCGPPSLGRIPFCWVFAAFKIPYKRVYLYQYTLFTSLQFYSFQI